MKQYIQLSPTTVYFADTLDSPQVVTLTNSFNQRMLFKFRSTNPKKFRISPNKGDILAHD